MGAQIDEQRGRGGWWTLALAMAISLWIHVLGLALWRYSPPAAATPEPPPIVVELEVPSPEEAEAEAEVAAPKPQPPTEAEAAPEEAAARAEPAVAAQPPEVVEEEGQTAATAPPVAEETISLESRAPEYISYLGRIKAEIARHWVFPPAARRGKMAGKLTAVFTIDRQGRLAGITVEESAGNAILDHAALEAVRGAAPFGPFPEHINLRRLNIRANFDYRIRYVGVK